MTKLSWKILLFASFVALMALLVRPEGGLSPRSASAAVSLGTIPNDMESNSTVQFTLDMDADEGIVTISVDGSQATTLLTLSLIDCNGCDEEGDDDTDDAVAGVQLTIDTDDANFTADQTVTLQLEADCDDADDTLTISVSETGGGFDSDTIDCSEDAVDGDFAQVIVDADPNVLPCKGGTSDITARVVNQFGFELAGAFFHFQTTAGLLERTGPDTAELTLGPGQISATVTASIPDPVDEEIDSATVNVSLSCNANFVSVVVTANPNVLPCGGISEITATARDANGHVVKDVGFHFATDTGSLVVSPNNAKTDKGTAALSLLPGMPSSVVRVSVGTLQGTVEGTVTVQQYCPGVQPGQDASMATGAIVLSASSQTVNCGERVFIGARVRDSKNQIVPNGTVVNLVASKGTLIPPSAGTTNGVLHIAFEATPGTSGPVRITAASGDAFGELQLSANCLVTAGPGATPGAATAGAAPCIPIGDGVCIRPPSTGGGQITPPSTGDAGLLLE
jgi:hypothetical protein